MPADQENAIEVFFVDDEPFYAAKYREALEADFKVHFVKRAAEVIPLLQENPQIKLVVLDIMMPPPEGVIDDGLEAGLNTGVWLLEEMCRLETWPFPVLILTNRKPIAIQEKLVNHGVNNSRIEVRQKANIGETDLVALVQRMLE